MHQDTILKQIPHQSIVFSNISYYNSIKYVSDCDIPHSHDFMIGHAEEVLKEQEISLIVKYLQNVVESLLLMMYHPSKDYVKRRILRIMKFSPNQVRIKNPYPHKIAMICIISSNP